MEPLSKLGCEMREGAWIQSANGVWAWIDEHASWIQRPGNAERLGVPCSLISALRSVAWDFNGRGRHQILRHAMEAGLIRFRGHGAQCTFEARLPVAEIAAAVRTFMAEHCGPRTFCRITDLTQGVMLEAFFEDLEAALQDPARFQSVPMPTEEGVHA